MVFGHVPAGYLLTRRIAPRSRALLALGLAASVLPDADLVRFYLVDHGKVFHHAYWTHVPFWWAVIATAWFGAALLRRSRAWALAGAVLFSNVLVHLVLDTVTGHILWLAPFSARPFGLFAPHRAGGAWLRGFLGEPWLPIEAAIVAWAAWELARARSPLRTAPGAPSPSASGPPGRGTGGAARA